MTFTKSDLQLFIHEMREAIAAAADGRVEITMAKPMAELFVDFLINTHPDMARAWRQLLPQPLLLGQVVGNEMIDTKLRRLDEMIHDAGVAIMLMTGLAAQLERMVERQRRAG